MKKIYFKGVTVCLALIGAAFIIHSCKKESKFTQLSLTDSVNQAKSWYETTYPINTSINSKLTATQSVNTASTSGVDYSQLIKPDWVHAANYKRFNKAVIELPVDPSAAMAFSLKNKTTGQTVYSKENSKTSFILLNDGKGYAAYIMTILADPGYLGNDHSKLAHNTFRKHDADFTGMVFYFTPKGQFVRSYAYKQGKLITPSSATAATQTTQNVNSAKKVAVAAPPTCLDWYWDTWNNGELISDIFLYETCSGGDDPDGGSGSPDPVCTTEGTNSITSSHLSVNVATPPDGGDDPGYPDPTPGATCPVVVPPDTNKTPCAFDVQLSANQALINKLNNLKSHLDDNAETGYTFTDASDPNTYSVINGDPNTMNIDLNISGQISGLIHTHPDGAVENDGSPILSDPAPTGDDVKTIYTLLSNNAMINPSTFFISGITSEGTAFTVQITDLNTFRKWAATNLTATGNNKTAFQAAIDNSFLKYYNNQMMDRDISKVLSFLDNMPGSGLSLSFANYDDLNNWTPVTSNNGAVVNTNCNN